MQCSLKGFGGWAVMVATLATVLTPVVAYADYKTAEEMAANKLLCENDKNAMACLLYGDGLYIVALKARLDKTLPEAQVKEDVKSAMIWKSRGCDLGSWRACEVLGYAYTHGHGGLTVDKALGYDYFKKACEGDSNFCAGFKSLPASNASRSAKPLMAGASGYSYCVVLNDTSRKVFVSSIFQRDKGTHQDTDGVAFAAEKRLDQPGGYDPAPPKLRISCNWDATLDQAKERLKNTEGQARKNNINFLGIGWSPAP